MRNPKAGRTLGVIAMLALRTPLPADAAAARADDIESYLREIRSRNEPR